MLPQNTYAKSNTQVYSFEIKLTLSGRKILKFPHCGLHHLFLVGRRLCPFEYFISFPQKTETLAGPCQTIQLPRANLIYI